MPERRVPARPREGGTLLQTLFEQVPVGIAITDLDNARLMQVNRRFEALVGYPREQLLGKSCYALTYPADRPVVRQLRKELIEGEMLDFTQEKRVVNRSGAVLWVHNNVSLVCEADGAPSYTLELVENVTQRKQSDAAIAAAAEQLHALTQRLVTLQETERRTLAGELHDSVGQSIAALGINLSVLHNLLGSRNDEATRVLDESKRILEETGRHVRAVIADLRPVELQEFGLVTGLRSLAATVGRRFGLAGKVEARESGPRLPEAVESVLFRIAQEALVNAAKHAHAKGVSVILRTRGAGTTLCITDDGRGFDMAAPGKRKKAARWGLVMMRERAQSIGAHLYVRSAPGRGTRILVAWRKKPRGALRR
jgi:PAS domain S-box-containing protein